MRLYSGDKVRRNGGISIQSHGATHRRSSTLDGAEQQCELRDSKAALEAHFREAVTLISFPYGDDGANPQALRKELEQAGYRAACLYRGGPISFPPTNPYRLPRLAMGPDTDLEAALVRGEFLPLRQPGGPVGPVGEDGGATGESPELHVREALCGD